MDKITVRVDELYSIVNQMMRDAMHYVEISIDEPIEDFDGDEIPAQVSFHACSKTRRDEWIDYESVDAISER